MRKGFILNSIFKSTHAIFMPLVFVYVVLTHRGLKMRMPISNEWTHIRPQIFVFSSGPHFASNNLIDSPYLKNNVQLSVLKVES